MMMAIAPTMAMAPTIYDSTTRMRQRRDNQLDGMLTMQWQIGDDDKDGGDGRSKDDDDKSSNGRW